MKKERNITIKVIENKRIKINKLAEFFARQYTNKYTNKKS